MGEAGEVPGGVWLGGEGSFGERVGWGDYGLDFEGCVGFDVGDLFSFSLM